MTPAFWLSLFFAIYYFGYGTFLPFWALWLDHIGASAGFIGILLGLGMAARCIGNIGIMSRVRAASHLLPAVRWLSLLSMLGFACFYGGQSSLALVVLMVLVNLIYPTLMPVGEAIASRLVVQVHLDYGKSRLWGAVAFIVANLVVGSLSSNLGPQWVLHSMVLSLGLLLLLSLLPMNPAPADGHLGGQGDSILQVWRRPGVQRFLFIVALLQGSHAFYYGFSALHWQQQGYSTTMVGYLWGLGVLAEIVVLAMNKRWFERFGARQLLLAGAVCALLRWSMLGATTELGWLMLAQLLHAGSFCLAHLGAMRYISRDLDGKAVFGAQALYAAIAMGLTVALLLVLCGQLYPSFGGQMYWLMTVTVLPAFWLLKQPLTPSPQEA